MLHPRPYEATYFDRQLVSLALILVSLPRVMLGHTLNHAAAALLVWGVMGLLFTGCPPPIPRAFALGVPGAKAAGRWRPARIKADRGAATLMRS